MTDDMETNSMNELFCDDELRVAQVYTSTDGTNTSILVSNDNGDVYFSDVIDVPEITGIQRGVSFVKNNLDFDKTEIYPHKLDHETIMKDAYINYCRVNHTIGTEPNEKSVRQCKQILGIYKRWNIGGIER